MKTKRYLTIAVTLLTSSLSAFATNNDKIPGATVQDAAFFTGKPYDADLESYVFNYRNYSDEAGRWATSDPSGFPDGANTFSYIKNNITVGFDPTGCEFVRRYLTGTDLYRTTWSEILTLVSVGAGVNSSNAVNVSGGLGWTSDGSSHNQVLLTTLGIFDLHPHTTAQLPDKEYAAWDGEFEYTTPSMRAIQYTYDIGANGFARKASQLTQIDWKRAYTYYAE